MSDPAPVMDIRLDQNGTGGLRDSLNRRRELAGLPASLRPLAHVQELLLKIGPRPAPLRERAEDVFQQRELLVKRRQLGLQRTYAAPLGGDAVGDRRYLR
jgi:hypothetical protein